ncbi:hypothetical protein [Xanthomonas citri]|uniref:hypothetical protein n=1 Tax=Xanthomonas citri TaxID=346 RepID=UPI001D176F8E|nr:hypothetical protein [Xanthomonas citri]
MGRSEQRQATLHALKNAGQLYALMFQRPEKARAQPIFKRVALQRVIELCACGCQVLFGLATQAIDAVRQTQNLPCPLGVKHRI